MAEDRGRRPSRQLSTQGDDSGYERDLDEPLDPPEPEDLAEADRLRKLHEQAIDDYKRSIEHFADQRKWDAYWRRFYRAIEITDQWDEEIVNARKGVIGESSDLDNASPGKVGKPTLMVNESKQPIQQTINEARQARLGLYVKPERGQASVAEAETRQGLLRGIQYHSNAWAARLWALESAAVTGRGWYRVDKEYTNDGDDDLDLTIRLMLFQDANHPDPAATQLDLSDSAFHIIEEQLSHAEFKRRYPKAKMPRPTDAQLDLFGQHRESWWNDKSLKIAEYFYVEQKFKIVFRDPQTDEWTALLQPEGDLRPGMEEEDEPDPELFDADDERDDDDFMALLPEGVERWRKVPVRVVKWCLFNAAEILDENEWEGEYIPVIQTVGRVHVVDGKVMFKGLTADAVSPQQLINFSVSGLAMQAGSGSQTPWLVDYQQISQFLAWWDNVQDNYNYLPYAQVVDGQNLGVPKRDAVTPPIADTIQLLSFARELLKGATGRFGASLGDISPDRSGKAVQEMKLQGELGSSDFLDNLASIAMHHESRVLNGMLFPVYGYPGRAAKLILGDNPDEQTPALINQSYVETPDGPRPMQPPSLLGRTGQRLRAMGRAVMGQPPAAPQQTQFYRLTKTGGFGTRWVVGKSQATERDEGLQLLTSILKSVKDPGLIRVVIPIMAKLFDGPAARELAEALSPKGPDGSKIPPQVQALVQDLQQKLTLAVQAAQEANQKLQNEEHKLSSQERIKQMEIQSEQLLKAKDLTLELAKLRAAGQGKIDLEQVKGDLRQMEQIAEHAHEERMQARELAAKAVEEAKQADRDDAARAKERVATAVEKARERASNAEEAARDREADATTQARDHAADAEAQDREHAAAAAAAAAEAARAEATRQATVADARIDARDAREHEAKTETKDQS